MDWQVATEATVISDGIAGFSVLVHRDWKSASAMYFGFVIAF